MTISANAIRQVKDVDHVIIGWAGGTLIFVLIVVFTT